MIKVTDDSMEYFDSLVKEGKCVVKFSAVWCGPCRALGKTIEAMESDFPDVKFFEVDVDECNTITSAHSIRSVPVLKFYTDGKLVDTVIGGVGRPVIEAAIKKI